MILTDEQQEAPTENVYLRGIFDVLLRGQYASAKFFDAMFSDTENAFGSAWAELLNPTERLSFSDVIERNNPEFATAHPLATKAAGLIGDIAFDPLTYITLGPYSKIAGGLSKAGQKMFTKEVITLGKDAERLSAVGQAIKNTPTKLEELLGLEMAAGPGIATDSAASLFRAIDKQKLNQQAKANLIGEAESLLIGQDQPLLKKMTSAIENDRLDSFLKTALSDTKYTTPQRDSLMKLSRLYGRDTRQMFLDGLAPKVPSSIEIEQTAAQTVAKLAANAPELLDLGGVKFAGKTVIPGNLIKGISNITGLSWLTEKVGQISAVSKVIGAFNRFHRVPKEVEGFIKEFEGKENAIGYDIFQELRSVFNGLSETESRQISEVAMKIQDETVKIAQDAGRRKLTDKEAAAIVHKNLGGLTDKQKDAYARVTSRFQDIGKDLVRADLVGEMAQNYWPRVYDGIDNAEFFKLYRNGLSDFLPAGERRKIDFLKEAEALGYKPEMDAAVVYAVRAMEARKSLLTQELNDRIKTYYGKDSISALPKEIQKELTFMGDRNFPPGLGETARAGLQGYDAAMRMFRKFATVIKPSFAVKQGFSNLFQSYAAFGWRALKGFNPSADKDAVGVILHNNGWFPDADQAAKWLGFRVKSVFGDEYTGEEISKLVKTHGIMKGSDLTGDIIQRNIRKELDFHSAREEGGGKGLVAYLSHLGKYTNWPSNIEDFARTSVFMSGLRSGKTPREAAELVNKALFDYSNGLSRFERQVVRRFVPFYSFQRFAYPLIARTLASNPGRVANLEKVAHGFFEAYSRWSSGTSLTDSERRVLPGFLLEQPFLLDKFDEKKQAVFRTFNNFNFLDVLGMAEVDGNGDLDFRRTIEKTALANMAPIIKVPFELVANKNFFTDQVITGDVRSGKISASSIDGFLSNVSALMFAQAGVQGIVGGKILGKVITSPESMKEVFKDALSWEEQVNPRSGKTEIFINPWMSYLMTALIPSMGVAIRADRPGFTPQEKAMDLLFGANTLKSDLRQGLSIQAHQQQKLIEEKRKEIYQLMRAGREDMAEQRQRELQELITDIMMKRAMIDTSQIRGGQ